MSRNCRPRWTNPREVAARRTMAERKLDLADAQARRAPRRSSSAPRSRTRPQPGNKLLSPPARARAARKAARAPRCPQRADQRPRDALRETEASSHSLCERGDGQVAARSRAAARGRRRDRRHRAAALPATRRARRLTGPGPCRGAAGAGRRRPPPPRRRRCGRASRRPRRSPPRPETRCAAAPRSSPIRASSSRAATRIGQRFIHPPSQAAGRWAAAEPSPSSCVP